MYRILLCPWLTKFLTSVVARCFFFAAFERRARHAWNSTVGPLSPPPPLFSLSLIRVCVCASFRETIFISLSLLAPRTQRSPLTRGVLGAQQNRGPRVRAHSERRERERKSLHTHTRGTRSSLSIRADSVELPSSKVSASNEAINISRPP